MSTLALCWALAGCAATEPLDRADLWRPTGVNEANIAAQVADPADLALGRASGAGMDGELAAAAVLRLRTDKVKKLPDSGLTDLKVGSSSGQGGS